MPGDCLGYEFESLTQDKASWEVIVKNVLQLLIYYLMLFCIIVLYLHSKAILSGQNVFAVAGVIIISDCHTTSLLFP